MIAVVIAGLLYCLMWAAMFRLTPKPNLDLDMPKHPRLHSASNVAAWRCGVCCEAWPPFEAFRKCPKCDEQTKAMYDNRDPSYGEDEAFRLKNLADFNRYLAENGREDLLEAL